jgi:uncharacterized protein (TIGR02246 family)
MTPKTPEDIHKEMAEAFNAADVDAFVALHEEDAVTIPPHTGEPATGHEEIRASIEPVFAMRPKLTNEVVRKIQRDGLALTLVRWELSGTDPNGNPIEMSGEGSVVSRRQHEGGWRIVMESPARPD